MLERTLVGLLMFALVGPAVGGLAIGLKAFLTDPVRDWALLLLFPFAAYFVGLIPAAVTGAIAGALHPSRAQAIGHFVAVCVLGSVISAVTVYVLGQGDEKVFALCGFVASLVCEPLRRRFHATQFAKARSGADVGRS
ncbi:hypothetical protein AB4059_00360 [Lysobacter sp. 2RAF19]